MPLIHWARHAYATVMADKLLMENTSSGTVFHVFNLKMFVGKLLLNIRKIVFSNW